MYIQFEFLRYFSTVFNKLL